MSKILLFVALVFLVAVLACGGEDATEIPADTPPPTVAPTAMPEPTAAPTPEPTATPTPEPEPTATAIPAPPARNTAAIVPLHLDDPLKVAGELSEAELECVYGVADLGRLMQIFSALEQASPDEMSQLIDCMEDETVLRLFITQLVGLVNPLSEETSDCIRAGMEAIDPRMVMLAGIGGDPQAAMMGSMASLSLIISCMNDEEFAAVSAALGMEQDDREGMQCFLAELGGPEGIAAFSMDDEQAMMALFGAAITCGVEMEGSAGQGTDGTPGDGMDAFVRVMAGLSGDEIACLAGVGISLEMLQDPSVVDSSTPQQQAQFMGCLGDDTLLKLFLTGVVGDPSQLSDETLMCIRGGTSATDLRAMMMAGEETEAAIVVGMSAYFVSISCLNDEELAAAESILGMTADDRDGLECLMIQMGGPEEMTEALSAEDGSGFMALFGAALGCGVDLESLDPGG